MINSGLTLIKEVRPGLEQTGRHLTGLNLLLPDILAHPFLLLLLLLNQLIERAIQLEPECLQLHNLFLPELLDLEFAFLITSDDPLLLLFELLLLEDGFQMLGLFVFARFYEGGEVVAGLEHFRGVLYAGKGLLAEQGLEAE